jgi:hypothetical protein
MVQPPWLASDVSREVKDRIEWSNGSWVIVKSGKTVASVTAVHPQRLFIDEVDQWAADQFETVQYVLSGNERNPPELLMASTAYSSHGLMAPLLAQAKQRKYKESRYCLWETLQPCSECVGKSCPLYAWENPRTGQWERLCNDRALRSDGFVRLEDAIDEFYRTDSETYQVQKLLEAPERKSLIYPTMDPDLHCKKPPKEIRNAPKGIGVDWGYDHPLVFTVFCQLGNGIYWGLEEFGERFVSPTRELEIAHNLNEKYRWQTGRGLWDYPTFYCGRDQPQSINSFAQEGLIVAPNSPRLREEGHKLVRRLLDKNKGPLVFFDPDEMPMTIHQLGSMHRDDKGREVLKDNDFGDSTRHVLATSQEQGGIRAGGSIIR